MNAPWKPLDGSNREPFHAYVSDEHSLEVIRSVLSDLGWPPEKAHKGGLRHAVQSLSIAASPSILFVDLSESGDPLSDINSLAEVCEPGTIVVASGQVNDVRLYRDLLASGIQDYLLKPLNPDHVRDSIAAAQAAFLAPRIEPAADKPHISVAVVGVRGGVGASTVATSLAWHLSDREKRLTGLLDLDVHFGTGALTLDLEPGRGLTDAIENPGRIDGLFIERAMVRATDRLAILSAEAAISQPIMTDGVAYHHLQEEIRNAFECTVVDLPRSVMITHPHLLYETTAVVLVTEFTLAAARDTIRILGWLKNNAPNARVLMVANKCQTSVQEIARKDFEHSTERKIDLLLPYDAKAACDAAKLGKALSDTARTTKLGQALAQLGKLVLGAVDASDSASADAAPKGKRGGKTEKTAAPGQPLLAKLKLLLPTGKRKATASGEAPAPNRGVELTDD